MREGDERDGVGGENDKARRTKLTSVQSKHSGQKSYRSFWYNLVNFCTSEIISKMDNYQKNKF